MEERSFRAILSEILEGKAANSAVCEPQSQAAGYKIIEQTPLLTWENPGPKVRRPNPYPRAPRPQAPRKVEVLLAISELKPEAQWDVELLVRMGAPHLKSGISPAQLKKAHRHLIKTWHPDRLDKGLSESERRTRHEGFLALQAAFERLSQTIISTQKP